MFSLPWVFVFHFCSTIFIYTLINISTISRMMVIIIVIKLPVVFSSVPLLFFLHVVFVCFARTVKDSFQYQHPVWLLSRKRHNNYMMMTSPKTKELTPVCIGWIVAWHHSGQNWRNLQHHNGHWWTTRAALAATPGNASLDIWIFVRNNYKLLTSDSNWEHVLMVTLSSINYSLSLINIPSTLHKYRA